MMNLFDRVSKLKLLRDKASKFAGLDDNLEFNQWREDVVEKRLLAYLGKTVNADLDSEAGREEALTNLRNYQQLKYVCKDVFKVWKYTEATAIKQLNKLDENSSQPQG